ncbi:MAG: hypothetical protein H7335_21950 [Massilia sp.]|nr:hypothetical protein [Massilia sp.]
MFISAIAPSRPAPSLSLSALVSLPNFQLGNQRASRFAAINSAVPAPHFVRMFRHSLFESIP